MRKIFHLLLLCLLATFAGAALADDDVCDHDIGIGFGLCTAYCDATECDCSYDPDCEPNADPVACQNLLYSYSFVTGTALACGDICPCIDPNGWPSERSFNLWNDFANGDIVATSCNVSGSNVTLANETQIVRVRSNMCETLQADGPAFIPVDFKFTLTDEQAATCAARLAEGSNLCP